MLAAESHSCTDVGFLDVRAHVDAATRINHVAWERSRLFGPDTRTRIEIQLNIKRKRGRKLCENGRDSLSLCDRELHNL